MRILLVEGAEQLRCTLKNRLVRDGHVVEATDDARLGLDWLLSQHYDLLILDLSLRRQDGIAMLGQVREAGCKVDVLTMSVKEQVAERISSLELGARDYLVKPVSYDELAARVRGLALDPSAPANGMSVGDITLNQGLRDAYFGKVPLKLTEKEYVVLKTLCLHRGVVLSRQQLIDYSGKSARQQVTENSIEVVIHGLRKKLKAVQAEQYIRTRRGLGYFVD